MRGERIACPDLERPRFPLFVALAIALFAGVAGCGDSEPDASGVLDRALTRGKLAGFGASPDGSSRGGVVAVQALGYEDGILDERRVGAPPAVMDEIRAALGADSGLRGLAGDLAYEGTTTVDGVDTDHISGSLEVAGLAAALEEAGADEVGSLAGVERGRALGETLAGARFDLYAGREDGVIRRLDLTLSLDDPDNALPPTRIRFSLTPAGSGETAT